MTICIFFIRGDKVLSFIDYEKIEMDSLVKGGKYNLLRKNLKINNKKLRNFHGFKNRTEERTGKGSGSCTSGPTGVGPVVEPMTSSMTS